jgi:hypothetical protein
MMNIAFSYSEICVCFAMATVWILDHPRFVQRKHRILIHFNFVFAVPQPRRGL